MKIQPIDIDSPSVPLAESGKPVLKSRLKRLFDRPFTNVLRSATSEKPFSAAAVVVTGGEVQCNRDGAAVTEFEPSSVCLAKMVQNFIEESNEKQAKCGRNRCNCFNGNNDSSSDDELDLFGGLADSFNAGSPCDASDHLKVYTPVSLTFRFSPFSWFSLKQFLYLGSTIRAWSRAPPSPRGTC